MTDRPREPAQENGTHRYPPDAPQHDFPSHLKPEDTEDFDEDAPDVTVHELRSAPNARRVRLDQFITRSVENASRSKVKALIEAGGVTVNGVIVEKAGRLVLPGDRVVCTVPKPPPPDVLPEDIPLDIVHEDDDIIIVNKPAGMVTHPAFGNYTGTLVNALLYHTEQLSGERGEDRPGILHRLDKDTSGLLAVAKNDRAHQLLARQFADHSIEREYQAVVWGRMKKMSGTVEAPLARHPSDRKKMAIVESGKHAVTHFTVIEDLIYFSLLQIHLQTGRTHQIRVHLASLRHPVFGDPTYGGRRIHYGSVTGRYKHFVHELLTQLPRQALHARTLGFIHPTSRQKVVFTSDLPGDMVDVLQRIRAYLSE
ncbi:MAG: RluA family pseudouridine synthase [Bacteroidetes bacterium]|nr:RluA family pseudouridine synthase [Bacteroidota bacterium]